MMIILTDKYRGVHVMGCGDCPFHDWAARECEIVDAVSENQNAAAVSIEHDMKTLPAWCPLRKGAITVSAEPGSVRKP